jgi:hypothetical protein
MNLADRAKFDLKPEDNRIWTKEEVDGLLKYDLQRFELGVLRLLGKLSLILLSALALILVWGHFSDRQFGRLFFVVIKRVLEKFF